MANNVQISTSFSASDGHGSKQVSRALNITPTGTKFLVDRQSVSTAVSTLTVGACANLRFLTLVNPSDSASTVTVTVAPMVLKPGDPAIFPPGSTAITLQSTATAGADIATGMTEA